MRLLQVDTRNGGGELPLRRFTPLAEVALCGHATLASAHALWQEGALVGFQSSRRGGVVRTRLRGDRLVLGGHAVTILRGELA